MKKIYLLSIALMGLLALPTYAQDDEEGEDEIDNTFQFQDADGNEIADGTTLTLTTITQGANGPQIPTGLYIKNVSGAKTAGSLSINISNMPNGSFASCAFGSCLPAWPVAGIYESAKKIVDATDPAENIETEWIPDDYADWTATVQLETRAISSSRFGQTAGSVIGYGPKVTLHFVYADPAGIKGVTTDKDGKKEVKAIYSVNGAQLTGLQHGLNIVRYTDGTTAKVMK